jgi:polysaccharide export outer membrane protein
MDSKLYQAKTHRTQAPGPPARWPYVLGGLGGLIVLLGLSAGCATPHNQMVSFLRAHEAEVATGSYVVRPPDTILISAPRVPEVDGTAQMVRADGKVVLRLLGEVEVAGLTTEQVADKLKAQLSRFYVEPDVVVQVGSYNSQFFYVFGEVTSPGPRRFTGRDTLLMALAEAQPTPLAWRSQVRVTRPAVKEPERKVIVVDLDRMIQSGDTTMNILLQEGDIVEVPPTPLAWVGHRFRELMYPIEPALHTYNMPTGAIDSTHTYEDAFGSSSNENSDGWRRRFGR